MGPPPAGRGIGIGFIDSRAEGEDRDPGVLTPGITSLAGQEPELEWEVYWCHVVITGPYA